MAVFEGRFFGTFSYKPGAAPDRFALLHLDETDGLYHGFYGIGNGIIPDPEHLPERTSVQGKLQGDILVLKVEEKCSQHAGMVICVTFPDAHDPENILVSLMEGAMKLPMQRL